jgi:hypothetical protein
MGLSPIAEDIAVASEKPGDKVTVRVFRSVFEMEEIRSVWTSWNCHPNSDIDFYLTVNRLRPEIIRPHVVVLYRDGHPEAMLIGRMVKEQIGFRLGYWTIFRLEARLLRITYGGLLGNSTEENCGILVRSVLDSLCQGEADVARLSHVRADSPLFRSATTLPGFASRDYVPSIQVHRTLNLSPTAREFQESLSKKVRKNLRWQAKKFLEDYKNNVKLACFRDSSDLDRMIREVEEVAKKTYQRGLGVGFEDSHETRERLRHEADKGWLRMHLLYVNDRPSAYWWGTVYGKTFHSVAMGYDPGLARYSPGMFLVVRVIESLCGGESGGGVETVDFGLGDAQYKDVLGNEHWQDASLFIYASTLKGLALFMLNTPMALASHVVGKGLEKTRLLQRVKTLWRRRLRSGD